MPVEAGLADHERESPAKLAGNLVDQMAHLFEPRHVGVALGMDAGRRAIFAEHFA